MKIYRRFFLGGQRWTAYLVSPKSKHLVLFGERKAGVCQYLHCKIYISNDAGPQAIEDTFIHEILHAMLEVSGQSKVFNGDYEAEEAFVATMTPHLHRFLKDFGASL